MHSHSNLPSGMILTTMDLEIIPQAIKPMNVQRLLVCLKEPVPLKMALESVVDLSMIQILTAILFPMKRIFAQILMKDYQSTLLVVLKIN